MLDGGAVVLGVDGVSDFDALHSRKHDDEVQFCAFDIMVEGDDDLRKLPLHLRKMNPQRLLARRPEGVFIDPVETAWAFRGWRQQRREASPKPMSPSKSNETLRNRPFEVKHFQTIRHYNVDVAHGLALLFGFDTRALPSWDSRTR